MKHKGYLCESCGKLTAKYEARTFLEGKNLLLCAKCLTEIKSLLETQISKDYYNHSYQAKNSY
ncbi:hypothetical protein SAMN05421852_104209 [Thermoflavimicrobium dichotomicum]|uniref:Uncharacterized protein n=1 Tax=Thermoflavimicrobium dichotomicum TaxID=46223 RepID=A0A1I3NMY3_9BACL|nr:hypothetical protein SAMN05421852_104209 [Thermoflavimicrobium dichotomicum]